MRPWKPIRTLEDLEKLLSDPAEVERRKSEGTLMFANYGDHGEICKNCGKPENDHVGPEKECPGPVG
jgi:hypothetical protein